MAAEEGLPILGICRGAQVLNVAFGGTLYQDIPSQLPDTFINHRVGARNEVMHSVRITEGTILHSILGETAGVNTSHHQAVKDVAPGFVISAVSEDGVVEAIEKSDAECIIGVQFHPEAFVAEGNDSLLPIFNYFIKAAGTSM
jgi:putative glutamine amidotransferase